MNLLRTVWLQARNGDGHAPHGWSTHVCNCTHRTSWANALTPRRAPNTVSASTDARRVAGSTVRVYLSLVPSCNDRLSVRTSTVRSLNSAGSSRARRLGSPVRSCALPSCANLFRKRWSVDERNISVRARAKTASRRASPLATMDVASTMNRKRVGLSMTTCVEVGGSGGGGGGGVCVCVCVCV
jgi:hypothetical protein